MTERLKRKDAIAGSLSGSLVSPYNPLRRLGLIPSPVMPVSDLRPNNLSCQPKLPRQATTCARLPGIFLSLLAAIAGPVVEAAGASVTANPPGCQVSDRNEIVTKAFLLKSAAAGDGNARDQYDRMVRARAEELKTCRDRTWPRTQAIWLRLYPCDLQPGALEQILDNIANLGYNRIYLNTFYDGRVLLPARHNPTVWPSVVGNEDANADLLAQTIRKAHQRGIQVHAWLFAMNFGPSYAARSDRKAAIARNGYGESNLQDPAGLPEEIRVAHIFVDPYNLQARNDLRVLVEAVAARQPDGIAFDYIRYPHRTEPIVRDVRDLMIYGVASGTTLLRRAITRQGQDLLYQYLKDGRVATTKGGIKPPLWKFPDGSPSPKENVTIQELNKELWQMALDHARQGVLEFLEAVALPARQRNIPVSAVFFPRANLTYDDGVDPRLQPWNLFKTLAEWAPMNYAACGNTECILNELSLVMKQTVGKQIICPVLAGYAGRSTERRVSLERQMYDLFRTYPQIDCVSHFAYSWFDFAFDSKRRSCKLTAGDMSDTVRLSARLPQPPLGRL